ncbi:peptidoglycan recognition family protein [Enterococcus mundtii]|uniref:N-acetylmuramoyl-L-alanine amidase n=1 Tax=Enterococcus mundtii TaxID=53346 RepID=A0AAI8R9C3_ENTMU|nr:peptidoglycan recognition family protein [Enterococcus mundtii]BAO07802.1 putative N-acetylmuramoyl-L-alanine amidase [Enterococcus mundtii QU 25]BBM14135.1 putative N-acetylmuramoyl-L-alanine amidase [Enterococcus mundtii]BBM14653.1 putative N-acetylmuramoyl-L-alanine amidase [Enterococcus mundtii]
MTKIQDLRGDSRILGPTNAKRNVSQVTKIARHHSATTTGDVWAFQNHWNGTLGWGTGGYHEIILRDGTVQWCYFDNDVTNGISGHNTPTYHICLVGNGSFTAEQEKAFEERAKAAMQRFGLSVNDVLGHNEFSGHASNICPGINMNTVRERLRSGNNLTHDQIILVSPPKTSGNYVGKLEVFNELRLGTFRIAGWLVPQNGAAYLNQGYVFWMDADNPNVEIGRCKSAGIIRDDVNAAYGLPSGLRFGLDGTLDIRKFAGKRVFPMLRRTNDPNGNTINGQTVDIRFPEYVLTIPKR